MRLRFTVAALFTAALASYCYPEVRTSGEQPTNDGLSLVHPTKKADQCRRAL